MSDIHCHVRKGISCNVKTEYTLASIRFCRKQYQVKNIIMKQKEYMYKLGYHKIEDSCISQ